jgi:hypothetical protein
MHGSSLDITSSATVYMQITYSSALRDCCGCDLSPWIARDDVLFRTTEQSTVCVWEVTHVTANIELTVQSHNQTPIYRVSVFLYMYSAYVMVMPPPIVKPGSSNLCQNCGAGELRNRRFAWLASVLATRWRQPILAVGI